MHWNKPHRWRCRLVLHPWHRVQPSSAFLHYFLASCATVPKAPWRWWSSLCEWQTHTTEILYQCYVSWGSHVLDPHVLEGCHRNHIHPLLFMGVLLCTSTELYIYKSRQDYCMMALFSCIVMHIVWNLYVLLHGWESNLNADPVLAKVQFWCHTILMFLCVNHSFLQNCYYTFILPSQEILQNKSSHY